MCSSESRATVIIAKTNEECKVRYATYVKTVMLYAGVTQIFFGISFRGLGIFYSFHDMR